MSNLSRGPVGVTVTPNAAVVDPGPGERSTLCAKCKPIFGNHDFTALGRQRELDVPFSVVDSGPAYPVLSLSASQGCSFCAILLKRIQSAWPVAKAKVTVGPSARLWALTWLPNHDDYDDNGFWLLTVDVAIADGATALSELTLRWDLYAEEGSQAASLLHLWFKPPADDRTSASCIGQLQSWIDECITTHGTCRLDTESRLPTRVIDVSKHDEKGQPLLQLVVADDEIREERYVALSHCWGPPDVTCRMTKTLKRNLAKMLADISLQSLPRNFQDAITVTRLLDIRFLWIDSLCIIQDDSLDWEIEASKMDQVYRNAYLTIAATSAATAESSFLDYHLIAQRSLIAVDAIQKDTQHCHIVLQEVESEPHPDGTWTRDLTHAPWNERAWTMQERYLSRRILHFCKRQIYWECRGENKSETGEIVPYIPFLSLDTRITSEYRYTLGSDEAESDVSDVSELSGASESITGTYGASAFGNVFGTTDAGRQFMEALRERYGTINDERTHVTECGAIEGIAGLDSVYEWWTAIVHEYSPRSLTYPSDKLPALSGLAASMSLELASRGVQDIYLAGLWRGNLAKDLLWLSVEDQRYGEKSTIPSWSWTRSGFQVYRPNWAIEAIHTRVYSPWDRRKSNPAIELVSYDIELAGPNPYGQVKKATLQLNGRSCSITISDFTGFRVDVSGEWLRSTFDIAATGNPELKIGTGHLDCLDQWEDLRARQPLYCLQVEHQMPGTISDNRHWSGLLVEPVDGNISEFRRVGVYCLVEKCIDWFNHTELQPLILV